MERAVSLALQALPIFAAACAGLWVVIRYFLERRRGPRPDPATVQQGQVIPPPSDEWATRAYEGLQRELKDEIADHAHTINRHRLCHELMADHGIPVPDDH
ncbi:hypothetical protein [Knoellia sp. LjRoot47]|uniref:hypothetical protein n=1 Tax=Knoellia sp. LjRoot47 TaxID=3342330 RepID=UPI003ED0C1BE